MMLSATCLASVAQQPPISHIEVNNVRATILGNGSCFVPQHENYDGNYNQLPPNCTTWEVPQGSGKETVYQHSLWFGGLDAADSLHLAARRFGQEYNAQGAITDYWSGPLKTTDASIDLKTTLKFHRVWNLTRVEIDDFIANHGNAGYQTPDDILTWPAHGEAGYAENLAPFVDVNNDGHYNPADGDYPEIKGDQCLFFIFNDSFGEHSEAHGGKLGLEVHAMVYAFNAANDEALNNTVFVNYKFYNRSSNNYHNTYLGLWNDWDLGYMYDDYVGCDVQRNSCFVYNGTSVDGNGEPWAYGDNHPVQVLTVLNGPDGLGMTGFMYHSNDNSVTGDPQNVNEYYYYLQGLWKDWSHIQYGGVGHPYDPNCVGPECNYMFPGLTDPDHHDFDWTEETAGNEPGDRRGLASVGPFDFPSGGVKELDYAMITVWKNNSQSAFERKGEFIDHVRELFDNGFAK